MTQTASASELATLTLDHILTDLEGLSSSNALFTLAQTSAQPSRSRTSVEVLQSFESGSAPSSRKAYVELSHQLSASYRTAQRLNDERVTAAQVGLVLPSERKSRASAASASQRGGGRDGSWRSGEEETSTRTDLLHAKVADLQARVDAWDRALQQAVQLVDGTPPPHGAAQGAAEMKADKIASASLGSGVAQDHDEQIAESAPVSALESTLSTGQQREEHIEVSSTAPPATAVAATSATEDVFEDDDPWSDLT
ncbi:hypothetical protein EX895_004875 [Sporisorium graminicola]|uniref:Uncharacterized protein n=1 Tax=Sporisorium graminicola TaxID=280036 RepID=A0A4U7KNW0_9BASI|nr:hypothetical protein EX895_004875 [Sporisorium graminicola]TKY86050.1 hypothetical protein EX895_004875 [Sporisorium graminicola]